MTALPMLVTGGEKLVAVFGHWPSFHDAEVVELRLDRSSPYLMMKIYMFEREMTIDKRGFYNRKNEVLVHFRFEDIEDVNLEGFNHQNVLADMPITIGSKIGVKVEGIFGVSGGFSCSAISISDVIPWNGIDHADR